ncbi:hypothetical protein OEA41_009276 [Lepraria neglecta]|uniref:Uncharacterized protein n=1 Tax=Lepraria neglecta TaxID=209136 RepID=A0AAD9Z3Z6_9LECA|nr:hypothetical protein OEA41_009276 [Lepraria neglecta]
MPLLGNKIKRQNYQGISKMESTPPLTQVEANCDSATPSQPQVLITNPRIAFISGHMNITPLQYSTHYKPRLDSALSLGHHIVIVDASALTYLLAQIDRYPDVRQHITVHVSRPGQLSKFQAMGVRTECSDERCDRREPQKRHLDRDARMTRASDNDILWARSEDEEREFYGEGWRARVSATEMNRLRRVEIEKDSLADG